MRNWQIREVLFGELFVEKELPAIFVQIQNGQEAAELSESFEVSLLWVKIIGINVDQGKQVADPQNEIEQALLNIITDNDIAE